MSGSNLQRLQTRSEGEGPVCRKWPSASIPVSACDLYPQHELCLRPRCTLYFDLVGIGHLFYSDKFLGGPVILHIHSLGAERNLIKSQTSPRKLVKI